MIPINSKLYIDDLDRTIESTSVLENLKDSALFITGGTGLILSALVDLICRYNSTQKGNIVIYVAGRSESGVRARFGAFSSYDYFRYVPYDATAPNTFDFECDHVIHGAGNAAPADFNAHPVDTILSNVSGLNEILKYAVSGTKKDVLFVSSSEVYGMKSNADPFREGDYGFIDILDPRSAYPSSKRAAETLCCSYSKEYDIRTTIVRPGHIYGPTARRKDNRVSSSFAFSAADGNPIIMKSDGSQLRSYCYVLDCVSAILTVLVKGNSCEAYNISNKDSIISIRRMAELLSLEAGVDLVFSEASETEKKGFNPMQNSSLNSDRLEQLGWKGLFSAENGFSHTIRIIREAAL